jgi:UDP-2,3-diacylglucosamine hydrolase
MKMVTTTPTPVRLDPPVYFLSDAHLGAERGEVATRQMRNLHRLLDDVESHGRGLVIAGDLFDFWFEWKTVVPKQYFQLLYRLRKLIENGIPVHLLAGNHDFRIHGFLESEVGMITHQNAIALQIADSRVFIFHGDGILARDHGYRLLKKILRSPTCQKLFSWLHPDFGMMLARGTSMTSRNATKGDPAEDEEYIRFARNRFAENYDGVVLGHAHRPMEIIEDGKTYLNLGDWIIHFTYAVHDGRTLSLKWFDETAPSFPGLTSSNP